MKDIEQFTKARGLVLKDLINYIEAASTINVHDEELAITKSMHYKNANTLLGMYTKLEAIIGKVEPIVISKEEEEQAKLIEEARVNIENIIKPATTSKVLVDKLIFKGAIKK
jgi:hypothetical protein